MDARTFDCAICAGRTLGVTRPLALGHGVSIWVCEEHGSPDFQRLHDGRELVAQLERVWAANGCLTAARRRALDGHLHSLADAEPVRPRPGSYAWVALRREAEVLFATGEPPRAVIDRLRQLVAGQGANPPSERTMMRWYSERRWLRNRGRTAWLDGPGGPSRGAGGP